MQSLFQSTPDHQSNVAGTCSELDTKSMINVLDGVNLNQLSRYRCKQTYIAKLYG
jgi:hypothetical protein